MKKIIGLLFLMTLIAIMNPTLQANDKITYDIYYFHATIRCQECIAIENFTGSALHSEFRKDMEDSIVKYTSIDFLEPDNQHYQDDYKFETQTLIISKKVNGKEVKWKNLDKIWEKSKDINTFRKYFTRELKKMMRVKK